MRVSTEDLKICSASYGTDQIYHHLPYIFVGRATYNLSVEYRSPNRTVHKGKMAFACVFLGHHYHSWTQWISPPTPAHDRYFCTSWKMFIMQ